ncbi:MAG: hypothetical protein AAF734_04355, partial [Bacteroidota bacterium]
YQCEFEAQAIDRETKILTRKKSISAKECQRTIKVSTIRLYSLWETSNMTKIYYIYHSLQTIYYQNQGQWQKLYDSIVSTEQMIAKGTLNSHIFEVSYNMYMKTFALWGLGRYEEGLTYMATALPYFKEGEHNYFSIQMHHVLLAIYATQYTRALGVITHVKSLENFKVIPKSLQEQFIISEAFIKLIGQKKKVSFHQVYNQLKTLRTHKEGMNINLLILELLLTLTAYDYMAFEQKLTNSFRSLSGYFKKQSNSRTRKFFQLLRHLVRKDFNATDAKEAGRYLAKTLEGNLEGVVLSNYEVVPYPTLWQYCLDTVKKTPYAV